MKKYLCLSLMLAIFLLNLCACSPKYPNEESSLVQAPTTASPYNYSQKAPSGATNTVNSNDLFFFTYSRFDQENFPTTAEFFEEDTSLQRLKAFHSALNNAFDFYELSDQPLEYCEFYEGDSKFCLSLDTVNQEIPGENGNNMYVTPIKALRLGKKLLPFFETDIAEGRSFNENDFVVTGPEEEISTILGCDYQGIYQIGDTIEMTLLTKNIKLKVIGFFKPGVSYSEKALLFSSKPNNILLDQLIVMPYYDIMYEPTDSLDVLYQSRYYLQRNSGYIKVEENLDCTAYINEAKELTKKISQEGFSYISPPEYNYYKDKVEQLSSLENIPYSVSISTIELAFSN